MLNEAQKSKALKVWNYYLNKGKKFYNASEEYTQEELDKERLDAIPEVNSVITKYLQDEISLDEFKSSIDSINKSNRLWGFKGISGQMYFNMLYNSSSGYGMLDDLDSILKAVIDLPDNLSDAKSKITQLSEFSDKLREIVTDKRAAPRTGSCLFFISYFWQIQDHKKFPVYYKSMLDVLQDLNIWTPSGNYTTDYENFVTLNFELIDLFEGEPDKELNIWDIEHAFWVWGEDEPAPPQGPRGKPEDGDIYETLPSSYVPPVVSIVPLLARNDPVIQEACKQSGSSVENVFEDRIAVLFQMLGYGVEKLGQGYGRVPDGIAKCIEYHYAIIFDAKSRSDGYRLGTDDRAIREYISHETEKLKHQGYKNVYFVVISSEFLGDFDEVVMELKMATDIREIVFIQASALLTMLEQRLRNTELDLGPTGIQKIFAQSGIKTNAEVKEFLGL